MVAEIVELIDGGALAIFALTSGFKLAFFLSVLVLSVLVDLISKKERSFSKYGLSIMAFAFMIVAILEFLHTMNHVTLVSAFFENEELTEVVLESLFVVAGIGLLSYLRGFKEGE